MPQTSLSWVRPALLTAQPEAGTWEQEEVSPMGPKGIAGRGVMGTWGSDQKGDGY